MIIFTDLGMRPKVEVEKIKGELILDENEEMLFDMAIRGKSAQEMAFRLYISPRTVFRMLARIRTKILNYYEAESCQ